METPKTPSENYSISIELGLKALTICSENEHEKRHHHNSCLMTSNPFPPPISPPSYSHISDYIGTESCGDLINNYDHQDHSSYRRLKMKKKKIEYPPPMTPLPFVLKRNCTNDGRLILTKEKHHGYMKAHRSNGRLTLELVVPLALDDDSDSSSSGLVENDHDDKIEEEFVHGQTVSLSKYYSEISSFDKEISCEGIGGHFSSVIRSSSSCFFDPQPPPQASLAS
ncbi:hypothetical protein LWI28_006890 [Acer negundo]|uniref:FAF domain-containing protein n=1 Tax=Acer negundo TaxID=4023 RepID=A0AAD5IM92_ACENE|nr:hypothetical protein LWI28_006890 [Acer negundo]KAK4843956.1 hypothetical protein QYF36_014769 [Acer negundo]